MDERILNIDGWMPPICMEWINDKVKSLPKNSLIVELGSWVGRSTAAIVDAMGPNMCFITIDNWLGQTDLRDTAHSRAMQKDIFLEFIDNMSFFEWKPKWYDGSVFGFYYLRMNSTDAPMFFDNNSVDMIFIDCDHNAVGKDIDAWHRKVKTGGIICGHDYNWTGVKPQVDDRVNVIEVIGEEIWVAIKE